MPELTAIAKAVRLVARASAESLYTQASQDLLNLRPLVMKAAGHSLLTMETTAQFLLSQVSYISLASKNISYEHFHVRATTDFDPVNFDTQPQIGMSMVGDFMVG
jgi:hypothetical protein